MGPVPTTAELTLDTVLMMLLPETVMPVALAVLDAVTLAFIVTVVLPTFVMTVLAGIPVPVRGCPIAAWVTDVAFVRVGLPMVAMAPNVALVLLAWATIVVFAGMPPARMFAPLRILAGRVPTAMTDELPAWVPTWRVVVSCVL
jgi:hypothetical protein